MFIEKARFLNQLKFGLSDFTFLGHPYQRGYLVDKFGSQIGITEYPNLYCMETIIIITLRVYLRCQPQKWKRIFTVLENLMILSRSERYYIIPGFHTVIPIA